MNAPLRRPMVFAPWLTSDERLNAQIDAAFGAVSAAFPFFEEEEILSPPRGNCLAALARQVFLHLLVNTFNQPKKRIAAYGNASLPKIKAACRTVEARRGSQRFSDWFDAVADDAAQTFARSEFYHG